MIKRLSRKEFKRIYSRVPRVTVEVIVKIKGGVILTLRDISPYKGQWHIPGGTIIFGETVEEAVKRVAMEELGVRVRVKKLLGIIEYPTERKEAGSYGQSIGLAHLVEILPGEKLAINEQAKDVKIFKKIPKNIIKDQKNILISEIKMKPE